MNKYHFNIRINIKDNNAGSKATEDCRTILVERGFTDLELYFTKSWYRMPSNFISLFKALVQYYFLIKPHSFILVQYPLLGINRYFKFFIKLLKKKGCKFCCVIHDLDSLRPERGDWTTKQELEALSAYDALISHNTAMTRWLRANSYAGYIEEIFLFDYLTRGSITPYVRKANSNFAIAFAGSLNRGTFLVQLSMSQNELHYNLYGPGFDPEKMGSNSKLKWYGSFAPDQIPEELQGDFGLVWDGDSIESVSGVMGNYIKYNSPHKTSLYLAAGVPVIVSNSAALAEFVEKNKIGFSINSLSEIAVRASGIDSFEYEKMRLNAREFGDKLRKGIFLQEAVERVEKLLF